MRAHNITTDILGQKQRHERASHVFEKLHLDTYCWKGVVTNRHPSSKTTIYCFEMPAPCLNLESEIIRMGVGGKVDG